MKLFSHIHFMFNGSNKIRHVTRFTVIICIFLITMWTYLNIRFANTVNLKWNDLLFLLAACMPMLIGFHVSGFFKTIWCYNPYFNIKVITLCVGASSLLMFCFILFDLIQLPLILPISYFIITMTLLITVMLFTATVCNLHTNKFSKNVAIFGAGAAGKQLKNALIYSQKYNPIVFIDDDPTLTGSKIAGLNVFSFEEFKSLVGNLDVEEILVAVPSVPNAARARIIERLESCKIKIKLIPGLRDIIEKGAPIEQVRDVHIEDLLERKPISPKRKLMRHIEGKVILVTGAGGSIGSELCRQIIELKAKKLILLDHSEYLLYLIEGEIIKDLKSKQKKSSVELISILESVGNAIRIDDIIREHDIDIIYHAAAYKHVPMAEQNVISTISNNIFGTLNVVQSAIKHNVSDFILISTDKAVRPPNIMGASKRVAELICQNYAGTGKCNTRFSIVRFGNVMDSSGSVIPLFKKQINEGGPVTVTHKNVTRYFMTIKEASQLVIQAGMMSTGGDVFLLDMGKPIKILDLAKRMIQLHGLKPRVLSQDYNKLINYDNEILIKITGLRKGEKLYEELLIDDNALATEHPRILKAHEKKISKKGLKQLCQEFEKAVVNNDINRIHEILLNAPIEYNPNHNNIRD